MKAVLTLVFVLIFGAIALAQNIENHDKVQSIEMGVVLVTGNDHIVSKKEMAAQKENSVARLYRRKNSKVRKELDFATKNTKAKLA
ncbi:hypothetical protein ACEZ3G_00410 [Maribacter algicola]|uniref:Uncharacterized protein n=1 Tax=Meishania litoralis TaxID=3434685 RepID=A0ACC7LG28_9FLAO